MMTNVDGEIVSGDEDRIHELAYGPTPPVKPDRLGPVSIVVIGLATATNVLSMMAIFMFDPSKPFKYGSEGDGLLVHMLAFLGNLFVLPIGMILHWPKKQEQRYRRIIWWYCFLSFAVNFCAVNIFLG